MARWYENMIIFYTFVHYIVYYISLMARLFSFIRTLLDCGIVTLRRDDLYKHREKLVELWVIPLLFIWLITFLSCWDRTEPISSVDSPVLSSLFHIQPVLSTKPTIWRQSNQVRFPDLFISKECNYIYSTINLTGFKKANFKI